MYQNLRRALPEGSPESVHFCDIPEAEAAQVRLRAARGAPHAARSASCACAAPAWSHLPVDVAVTGLHAGGAQFLPSPHIFNCY